MGRILFIVDDNASIRFLIEKMVAGSGDKVFEFSSAETAVSRYTDFKPDRIIMDIDLKGKDGLWATREIREINTAACIIIVSSHNSVAFRKAAQKAGASGFVWKEELDTLNTVIEKLV